MGRREHTITTPNGMAMAGIPVADLPSCVAGEEVESNLLLDLRRGSVIAARRAT
jgi:hypothetical protein